MQPGGERPTGESNLTGARDSTKRPPTDEQNPGRAAARPYRQGGAPIAPSDSSENIQRILARVPSQPLQQIIQPTFMGFNLDAA